MLGELVAAPLRRSAVFDLAFDQGEWVGSLQPGGPSHRELLVLAQRVLERLEAMQPSPWVQADEPERDADPSDPSDHARRPIFVETWRIRADLTRPSRWFDRLLGLFSRSRTTAGTIAT